MVLLCPLRDAAGDLLKGCALRNLGDPGRGTTIGPMNAVVAEATIDRAGRALIDAASVPAKVILFGSRARGDANDRSDFDFLVVERDVAVCVDDADVLVGD
jgi:hypothetical protein